MMRSIGYHISEIKEKEKKKKKRVLTRIGRDGKTLRDHRQAGYYYVAMLQLRKI